MNDRVMDAVCGVVYEFLVVDPDCRIDDDKLAALVEAHFNPEIVNLSYMEVRKQRYRYLDFSASTIARARRCIQAKYPELRPTKEQIQLRDAEEIKYKRYFTRGSARRRSQDVKER